MIVVIQCAGSKQDRAGRLHTPDDRSVIFVAAPAEAQQANPHEASVYVRPDDVAPDDPERPTEHEVTWRKKLQFYNERYAETGDNPNRLYPAYRLYRHHVYSDLVEAFGIGSIYILSAGWGLIPASFLTPYYDITFTKSAEPYKRRKPSDRCNDFALLPRKTEEDIAFIGSKEYRELFCSLTRDVRGQRQMYYWAKPGSSQDSASDWTRSDIEALGCTPVSFEQAKSTNWQYDCAEWFRETYGRRPS